MADKKAQTKGGERCSARQCNRRSPDFECSLSTGHTVHVDPRTSQRWSSSGPPRGMRRKYEKKYANRKLQRQSLLMGNARQGR